MQPAAPVPALPGAAPWVPPAGRGARRGAGPCCAPGAAAAPAAALPAPSSACLLPLQPSSSSSSCPPLLSRSPRPCSRHGGLRAGDRQVETAARPSPRPDCCCRRLLLRGLSVCLSAGAPSLTDSCPCSEYNLPNSLFFRYLQICATVSNFSSTKRPFQLLPN